MLRWLEILPLNLNKWFDGDPAGRKKRRALLTRDPSLLDADDIGSSMFKVSSNFCLILYSFPLLPLLATIVFGTLIATSQAGWSRVHFESPVLRGVGTFVWSLIPQGSETVTKHTVGVRSTLSIRFHCVLSLLMVMITTAPVNVQMSLR